MAGVQDNEELDSILHCPVCFEIPKSSPIHQCDRGHHLCEPCFQKLKDRRCPICKATYYGTRNFIAEELVKIFPSLRIEPPTPPLPPPAAVPSAPANKDVVRVKAAPSLCRGLFPCLFGKCNRNLGAGNMLKHIRDHHGPFLIEVSARNKYTEAWDFQYIVDSTFVEAIRIANMGLFFLVLDINETGLLRTTVQMAASEEVATMFKFKVKILDTKNETKMSFKDQVFSCRHYLYELADKGHCLELDVNKFSYLKRNGCLVCSISIIDGRQ